jgi:hypothetical protein
MAAEELNRRKRLDYLWWRKPRQVTSDLLTEKHFRRMMGYQDLWSLAGILGRTKTAASSKKERVA